MYEMLMAYATALSAVLLISHLIGSKILVYVRKTTIEPALEPAIVEIRQNSLRTRMDQLGGRWIFGFMGFRLVLSLALTLASFVWLFKSGDSMKPVDIALTITSVSSGPFVPPHSHFNAMCVRRFTQSSCPHYQCPYLSNGAMH